MIAKTIQDLKDFIETELNINCEIGDIDVKADDYPIVLIKPDLEGEISQRMGNSAKNVKFPVNIQIISERKDPLKAIQILDTLLSEERAFLSFQNHELTTMSPEFTDNTYTINCTYVINNFLRRAV